MTATESALVVKVPEAEPVVGQWRLRYDAAATWGVPAHVTVLYPFVPPDQIDDGLIGRVSDVIGAIEVFDTTFDTIDQFGTDVLILRPTPSDGFSVLTSAVVGEWPDYLPYEGVHEEVIPHLTVANMEIPFDPIRAQLQAGIPINTTVTSVDLMEGSYQPGSWHTIATFALG